MVSMPRRLASSNARTRLAELPLVDNPTAMSFRPPNAASWRANTTSTPTSLQSAVTTDVSLASPSAGSGGAVHPGTPRPAVPSSPPALRVEEQRGELLGVGGAAAVAEGEQPPARAEPRRGFPRALGDPRPVPYAHRAAQLDDLGRLGHGRRPHLVEHGGQVAGVGVQERIQRFHGVAHDGARVPTTAMASRACTRIVSPTPALTRATLTVSSPWPVSTTAIWSSGSRSTLTPTAVSEQVMQTSPMQAGRPPTPSGSTFTSPPPGRAHRAARRTRAPAPTARGTR